MLLGVFGLVVVLCMWWILMIIGFMLIMCPLRIYILNQSFDLFSENDDPWGIWSDNETVWVAVEFDSSNDYVDAYNLSDKSRDWSKDFSMSNASEVFSPRGIWSDGVTMWIVRGVE